MGGCPQFPRDYRGRVGIGSPLPRVGGGRLRRPLPSGPSARLPFFVEALRPPHLQGDSFYGERVTRKPGGGRSPATPLRYPPPPREKVSLRSPLSDGGKASSGTEVPIQEATTVNRWLSRALIDRSPGKQQSFCPRVSPPAVQPVGIIHILLSTVQAHVPFRPETWPFRFPQSFRESVENHMAQRHP